MIQDPIIDEVRQVRRQTEKACGHDWKRLADHYRRVNAKGARIIRREPKRLRTATAKAS